MITFKNIHDHDINVKVGDIIQSTDVDFFSKKRVEQSIYKVISISECGTSLQVTEYPKPLSQDTMLLFIDEVERVIRMV